MTESIPNDKSARPSDASTSNVNEQDCPEQTELSEATAPGDPMAEVLAGLYRAEGLAAQGFAALHQRLAVIESKLGIDAEGTTTAGVESPAPSSSEASAEQAGVADSAIESAGDANRDASEPETFPEVPSAVAVSEPTMEATPPQPELPPMAQPVAQPMPQPVQPVRDVRPVATPTASATQSAGGELESLVFGGDFPSHPSVTAERQTLLSATRQGQEDAVGLVGQLLIARSARMDSLPALLKDVGEAWYRWQGDNRNADGMRDALIAWLHHRLESVGLGNRIELVRVGDRYDSKRHNAKARGIEVTGVQGWVVLRDNGNVYTKANVTVA